MKPRKHAEVIRAWLDGADIEYRTAPSELWRSVDDPHFDHEFEYRVKPERAYPGTLMTEDDLCSAYYGGGPVSHAQEVMAFRRIATAAIKHACQNDQVVPMAEVREVARNLSKQGRDVRDMEIAEAVLERFRADLLADLGVARFDVFWQRLKLELAAIIAKVPA